MRRIWLKTKKIPSTIGGLDEFLLDSSNYLTKAYTDYDFVFFYDESNNLNNFINVFTEYLGDSTAIIDPQYLDTNGPRFSLLETFVAIDASEVEGYDFYELIDPTSTPVFYYEEEFIVTFTHSLSSSTTPGIYIVYINASDSLGNIYTQELEVRIT